MRIFLRRRHAPMVRNGAFSHKIDYITIVSEILNFKGHQERIIGSRVTAILLKGWIFPIGQCGEASRWRVCYQRGLPRLVLSELRKSTLRFFRGREYLINGLFIRDYTRRNRAKHPFSFISSPSEPKNKLNNK